jgi:hypothetical protein
MGVWVETLALSPKKCYVVFMKWRRNYELSIRLPDGTNVVVKPPFSIRFSVKRDMTVNPNNARIEIYNLGVANRNKLHKDSFNTSEYWQVLLKAGYGDNLPLIFRGNCREAYSERQGADYITTIDAFDGEYAFQNGWFAESLSVGGDLNGVIQGAAGLGLDIGYMLQSIPSRRGQAIDGNLKEVMDKAMIDGWFVDCEELNAIGKGGVIGDVIYRLDREQLLATPRKRDRILEVTTLFYPQVRIGRIMELVSTVKQYDGQYQIAELSHDVTISGAESDEATTKMSLFIAKYAQAPAAVGGNV